MVIENIEESCDECNNPECSGDSSCDNCGQCWDENDDCSNCGGSTILFR